MEHPENAHLLDAYADGALGPDEAKSMREHLAGCNSCSAYLVASGREIDLLRRALQPAAAPQGLRSRILATARAEVMPSRRTLPWAVTAGVLGNLVTGVLLVMLSLGTQAPLALMLGAAIVGALLWGGVKGLAFGGLIRFLPRGVVTRGLVFGAGVWLVTNMLLALAGGFGSSDYSTSLVLLGSLVHHLIYGLLISFLYHRFTLRDLSPRSAP